MLLDWYKEKLGFPQASLYSESMQEGVAGGGWHQTLDNTHFVGQACLPQMHMCGAVHTLLDCIRHLLMTGLVAGLSAGCLTQMLVPLRVHAPQLLNAHVI